MQSLWTSKSQVYRLEQSSVYGCHSDEVIPYILDCMMICYPFCLCHYMEIKRLSFIRQKSCMEHLCDSLCYQLDIASFVARVNSGQQWSSKFSLLLSGNETIVGEEVELDTFVQNFVLERLSTQSPMRVSLLQTIPLCEQ